MVLLKRICDLLLPTLHAVLIGLVTYHTALLLDGDRFNRRVNWRTRSVLSENTSTTALINCHLCCYSLMCTVCKCFYLTQNSHDMYVGMFWNKYSYIIIIKKSQSLLGTDIATHNSGHTLIFNPWNGCIMYEILTALLKLQPLRYLVVANGTVNNFVMAIDFLSWYS